MKVDGDNQALLALLEQPRQAVDLWQSPEQLEVVAKSPDHRANLTELGWQYVATLPGLYPERLGSSAFVTQHQLRYPYVVGAMANGIASVELVVAAAKAGVMAIFGAGGLVPSQIEQAIIAIKQQLTPAQMPRWGMNLIHSPHEPTIEQETVDCYLRHDIRLISASAYMQLTPSLVSYAFKGVRQNNQGGIDRPNRVMAKVSRIEVAKQFLSPPSESILQQLLARGALTAEEVDLARQLPVATAITAEADSGGHTDNRPLLALLPSIAQMVHRCRQQYGFSQVIPVGAAGGLGTPQAVASAFALGADYVLTGSINQACVESGLSHEGKLLCAQASMTDVTMAPASDMFELGVQLQVLKKGTWFAQRAKKLYQLYCQYSGIDELPAEHRADIEQTIFQASLDDIWQQTQQFFEQRDPAQLEQAKRSGKHKMALIFRWYLGLSSLWAIQGKADRTRDYQIWTGPAQGAFNEWVQGSFLQETAQRKVGQLAYNLMEGAAVVLRCRQLKQLGVDVAGEDCLYTPKFYQVCDDF